MKSSRIAVASVLSAALLISACSGDGDTDDTATTGDSVGSEVTTEGDLDDTDDTDGDAGASTLDADDEADDDTADADDADDADETADADADAAIETADADTDENADDDTIAMTTSGGGVISVEEAEEVATTVLTAAALADQGDGSEIREQQQKAYMSTARQAAEAEDRLESVFGAPAERDLDEDPVEANVLAISRDDGELPHYLLVQTVPESGVPELHLIESRTGELDHYRIVWEAPMLPGTEVRDFHPRSEGTPVLRSGSGDLIEPPPDTLKRVAAYTSYPQPEEVPEFRTHGYSPAVRKAAVDQAEALSGQAELEEKNWLISKDIRTLMFEDGSALLIGALSRQTTLSVLPNSELNPPDAFKVFDNKDVLYNEAVLNTVVFMGLRVPSESNEFTPEMIAVREQLVDASGS